MTHWNIVGHARAVAALNRDLHTDRLRHAYLFAGPAAVGKRTLALAFIQAILCDTRAACGHCRPCRLVQSGNHPDVITVAPVVSGKTIRTEKITIDRIRELNRALSLKPVEAARRIGLVTNFETANDEAANAFLKTLEEPPGNALLILTTDSPELLLPTITSRCEAVTLRPVPLAALRQALTERWRAPAERADLLARLSGGRPGWAVAATESTFERRRQRLDDLQQLLPAARSARFAYAEGLAKDRAALRETLELWLSWWRDVLLVASGASALPVNSDQVEALRRVAAILGLDSAAQAVAAVQRALAALSRNANARLAMEVLLLDLPKL
ncbi:MAG: DNA polymerase III subunit delta' [Chloroflexi bacterium]|nr:DNA polymerase III subunit delta' [Chloroflexota bacterium]